MHADGGSRVHAADDTPSKKAATFQLDAQRGVTSQCSSIVEEERDNASSGSYSRGLIGRKRCKQHCPCMIRSKAREEVNPEKGNRQ